MLQQMGVEAEARQKKKIEWTRPHACLVHTIKKPSSTTKRPCSSPPKFLATYGADDNKSSVYTLETWWCWRPKKSMSACENITLSVIFLFSEKACMSKWSEIRVFRIEEISTASLIDVLVLTQFSRVYTADRKKWNISALEILSLCSSVEDSML